METTPKDLQIYVTEDGRAPFSEWLASLRDIKARAKIRVRLDRGSLGNFGDCHGVGDGVHELRIDPSEGSFQARLPISSQGSPSLRN